MLDPRGIRTARLAMGAVLSVLALGILGGLMVLGIQDAGRAADSEAVLVPVTVETPEGVLFEGVVSATTPLEAIERAGLAAGFGVARRPDGVSLLAAAGRVDGEGGAWRFELARDGAIEREPGPEGTTALVAGDAVRWSWTPR